MRAGVRRESIDAHCGFGLVGLLLVGLSSNGLVVVWVIIQQGNNDVLRKGSERTKREGARSTCMARRHCRETTFAAVPNTFVQSSE